MSIPNDSISSDLQLIVLDYASTAGGDIGHWAVGCRTKTASPGAVEGRTHGWHTMPMLLSIVCTTPECRRRRISYSCRRWTHWKYEARRPVPLVKYLPNTPSNSPAQHHQVCTEMITSGRLRASGTPTTLPTSECDICSFKTPSCAPTPQAQKYTPLFTSSEAYTVSAQLFLPCTTC